MHGQIKQLQVLGDRLDEIEKFIEMIEVQKRLCVEYNRLQNKSEIPLENMEELLIFHQLVVFKLDLLK